MTSDAKKERARYWPISPELMAQYKDGSHTKNEFDYLEWRQNDKMHRDGDKPAIIYADGSLAWYQIGLIHRDGDKPAIITADGGLEWWKNGQLHRYSGPARIRPSGGMSWWIRGEYITLEVNEWLEGKEWRGTPEQIVEFQLRFT